MSEAYFRVSKHILPSQYIRHHPRSVGGDQEDDLHIAIKQYVPLDTLQHKSGDITIIGGHANGVGKELYEPLWDELYRQSQLSDSFRIGSIWMADVSFQGESGVLNESKLGNDRECSRNSRHRGNH